MSTRNITIAISFFTLLCVAILLGCTENNLTAAPTIVEVEVGPGTSVGSGSTPEAGQPTLSFNPPSITSTVGANENVEIILRDGTGQGISPSSITVGGLDPTIAVFSAVDERTLRFTMIGVGNTVFIISVTGPGVNGVLQRGYSIVVE